jgi:glycerate 2-kinase
MKELSDLRLAAREIFVEALKSVDAGRAVRRAVELDGSRLALADTTFDLAARHSDVYAIAIGKAALSMAAALNEVLGERLTAGVMTGAVPSLSDEEERVTRQLIEVGQISEDESKRPGFRKVIRNAAAQHQVDATPASFIEESLSNHWRVFAGGHPLPNEESLAAARAAFDLLQRADSSGALVIFLISGGGSAMIEWPNDASITLEDLRAANRVLVSCGASIKEINAVRRAFSAVKGGGLAARAPRARQVSLIVSDTNAGEEAYVASGPTFEPTDDLDAASIVARYDLAERLPSSILRAINEPPSMKVGTPRQPSGQHYVLLDNGDAIAAAVEAARVRGFQVDVARDLIEQPITEGSAQLVSRLDALLSRRKAFGRAVCLIAGGEFACPVRGSGRGGRNSETALRCAIQWDARSRGNPLEPSAHMVCLSAGTDGIDGNSPAAGAIADETTLSRARAAGLDAQSSLDRSDAYTFFAHLGETIMTGPTGTNVRDLRIMLAG